jgi:hypothetical protein
MSQTLAKIEINKKQFCCVSAQQNQTLGFDTNEHIQQGLYKNF